MNTIDLAAKLALFSDTWSPRVIAGLNDYQIKLVRLEGEFVWHSHDETDELFLCLEGSFEMRFRDRCETVSAGQLIVVPKGIEHCPAAELPCSVMIIEPGGVVNTGDAGGELTAAQDQWI